MISEEDVWRADMEAWISNFEVWAAHIQELTGEAPAVPQINLGRQLSNVFRVFLFTEPKLVLINNMCSNHSWDTRLG